MENIDKKLKECLEEKEKYLENWKRAQADLLNYKKEEAKRLAGLSKYFKEEIVTEILSVLDNMYLAEEKLEKNDPWAEGFLKIKNQLLNILEKEGVKEIEALNKKLDLKCHEIAGEKEKEDLDSETVVEVKKRGYTFEDKVLRPAKVIISKKRSEKSH